MHIHELRLETDLLEQQRDFYTRALGIPLRSQAADQCTLAVGSSALTFRASAQPAPGPAHFAFNIPGPQFAAAKRWLAERVALISDPLGLDEFEFPDWNAQACYFADPAGNIGELIARHDLAVEASQPFGGASLLCISEVGLVVDDPPAFAQTIQRELGSPVYRSTVNELFTPLGDEHGLLIVVKRGRLWFPGQTLAATPARLSLVVSDAAARRLRLSGPPYRLAPE